MKKIFGFVLFLFLLMTGCSKAETSSWTFINRSSQKVYIFNISPKGSPENVTLGVSREQQVSVEGTTIDYEYGPADALRHERDLTNDTVIFYDAEH